MSKRAIARGMRPRCQPLDDDSAARLLQGAVHPDDAPPGYGSVADLLTAAAPLPDAPVDEDGAAVTISAMVEAIRSAAPASRPSRRRRMIGKLLAGKALAAVAGVALTATGAAATGSLPDAVQGAVAEAVSRVGVDIPHPNHGKSESHRKDGDHGQDGKQGPPEGAGQPSEPDGPDNQGRPENHGQPTSGAAHTAKDAAEEAGDPVGPAVCTAVTDGKCQAGKHGPDGDGDEDTTPPSSGPAENNGQGQGPDDDDGRDGMPPSGAVKSGDDTTPTPPGTGGFETGLIHSGGRAGGPAGKGKPAD